MIETYGFFTVFTLQILAMSVLFPTRLSEFAWAQLSILSAERLAQLYPGVDLDLGTRRFLTRYRTLNTCIALLGLLLLAWFFIYMRRPDWNEGPVIILSAAYFMMQMLPLGYLALFGFRFNKVYMRTLHEAKRKAILERRGLLDFISPFIVFVAVASYFLFVGFVLYTQSKPMPGLALVGVLTLTYVLEAIVVYRALYGKKSTPLETHAARAHRIGLAVRVNVYSGILCTVFFAFVFTVDLLDLKRWVPLAQSVCLLITTLFCLMSLTSPQREPEVNEFGSSPVP